VSRYLADAAPTPMPTATATSSAAMVSSRVAGNFALIVVHTGMPVVMARPKSPWRAPPT
jgi:biotin carboxyl carrier protein